VQEERASFGKRYLTPESEGGCGLVDIYRSRYPDVVAYTYFSYR
jgi:exonuclease III